MKRCTTEGRERVEDKNRNKQPGQQITNRDEHGRVNPTLSRVTLNWWENAPIQKTEIDRVDQNMQPNSVLSTRNLL